ncbi:MAG: SH3 domain-containing protein [Pseudomonadota bacterium]
MRILSMILFFLLLIASASLAQGEMVTIAKKKVNMRSGPGTGTTVFWELGMGYPLKVLQTKGEWLKVQDFENDVGWVHRSLIDKKHHVIVLKKRVNIRSGPGTGYAVVGQADYGVIFQILRSKQDWSNITDNKNVNGWIKNDLLWGR